MKANAPEKIYLEWYRVGDEEHREWVITPKTNNESIEYTRTDAFIEKAKKWFEMQNEGVDEAGNYKCDMTDFEDFIKFISE